MSSRRMRSSPNHLFGSVAINESKGLGEDVNTSCHRTLIIGPLQANELREKSIRVYLPGRHTAIVIPDEGLSIGNEMI